MGRKARIPAETLLSLRRRLASLPVRAPERREENWPAPTEWSSFDVSALSALRPRGSGCVAQRSWLTRFAG